MRPEPTSFQTECEARLVIALERIGKQIINRCVEGISESYITGGIKDVDLNFWIYADGADIRTPHRHRHFEKPDHDSLEALADRFIEAVIEAVER